MFARLHLPLGLLVLGLFGVVSLAGPSRAIAGVSYQDPAGGWRYGYNGTFNASQGGLPPGYGTSGRINALDGTWRHDQSDKWDGSGVGDTQDPGQSTQKSPGGVSALTDGSTDFIRLQDTGNPEAWGFIQGTQPVNNNRRIYFGHQVSNDGALGSQLIMDSGVTLSFRVRIPDPTTTTMDPIYPDPGDTLSGLTAISPWGTVGGGGYPISNGGRGMFNVVQNDTNNFNTDSGLAFSLITSKDRTVLAPSSPVLGGPGSGGLIMNNLNGNTPTSDVDTFSGGTLNMVPLTDQQLYSWNEFWITVQSDPSQLGTHLVDVYLNGSTTPTEFHVTASGENTMEYVNNAWIAMGLSDTALFGSVDVDFFNYSLGVLTPTAAVVELPGDVNHDGIVNGLDISLVASNWLHTGQGTPGDANHDGVVNGLDISLIASNWLHHSPGTGNASAVPEPGTLGLVVIGLLAHGGWQWRRRRAS